MRLEGKSLFSQEVINYNKRQDIMFKDVYGIAAIIIMAGVLVFLILAKKKDGKDWVFSVCFAVVLFVGMALYYFAIDFKKDARFVFSPFFMIISSMGSAMPAFFGNFNAGSHLSDLAKESQIFRLAIITHFLTAVFLTSFTLIKLMGKKFINEIRVRWVSLWEKYIVISCNQQAMIFLKNFTPRQKQNTIIILQPSQADKKNELINKGYLVVTVRDEKRKGKEGENNGFEYNAFYDALKKAGAMNCVYNTRIISMSEQDETNLLIAKIMTNYIEERIKPFRTDVNTAKEEKDEILKKQEKEIKKMKLDIRIIYSFLERAEHFSFIENSLGKLAFFDPHKINAQKFCWENPITKLIPNTWIDTQRAVLKPNTDSGNGKYKISTIFIGFDSTNKAMLKTSIINNQMLNIDYNALVVCKNAGLQEKIFKNTAIGLFDETDNDNNIIRRGAEIKPNPGGDVYLKSQVERNIIKFKDADMLTSESYDYIINEIEGKLSKKNECSAAPCDYITVMIAMGDDRLSIETALELRQKLYEADLLTGRNCGIDYQRIRIFVKIKEKSVFTDEELINHNADKIKCKIIIYGADEQILTEEYIINEKLDILAKNIANRYDGNKEKETVLNEWSICTQHKRESNRYAAMAIRVKLNMLGFDLLKGENEGAGYADLYQTMYGINKAVDLRAGRIRLEEKIKKIRDTSNTENSNEINNLKADNEIIQLAEYKNNDFADTARNNLAKLEHQRWNAFYLANDWTKLPIAKIGSGSLGRQDGIAKQHACITTFHGLIDLMEMQKDAEKRESEKTGGKRFIEAESLLKADTIRHDFSTMDFLLELSDENLGKLRDAVGNPNKEYTGILTGSGYYIDKIS